MWTTFDIFLPVIALTPAAAHLFGSENLIGNAGLIFVATLLGWPIGAAIFGPISDRIGRTATTKIALTNVALTTLLIALVPSHATFGAGSLLVILALRFLGGEYTSAVPLAMEWSEPERRGLVSAARTAVMEYIESRYNRRRPHSHNGGLQPAVALAAVALAAHRDARSPRCPPNGSGVEEKSIRLSQ